MTHNDSFRIPTSEQIHAVLAFLPNIENPSEPFYTCDPEYSIFDPYIYSHTVNAFIQALYDNHLIQPFDWGAWSDQAKSNINDPGKLEQADLETIVKLFTSIVRADRFCSGTLAGFLKDGFILSLLKRLKTLSKTIS